MVTNATLQWVPGHLDLLPRWVEALAPGGWFAMQVPGNFDAPSHALLREVAAASARAGELTPVLRGGSAVADPGTYAATLAGLGCSIDVWETTYLHVLDPEGAQESPVLEWTKGTALRPVLQVLTDEGSGRGSWRRTRGGSSRPIRASRSARSSRSVASSPSPSGPGVRRERAGLGRDRAGPRPGVLPGRVRGPAAGVLRRGARHDREAQAARARGARRRVVRRGLV